MEELQGAGLSSHAAEVVARHTPIGSLDELRAMPWGDAEARAGLAWLLLITPNCGAKTVSEIRRLRGEPDLPKAKTQGTARVTIALEPELEKALDNWIRDQPVNISRALAVKLFLAAGLSAIDGDDARA